MLCFKHRVNDPGELALVPPKYGVEVDLHAFGKRIVTTHDAMTDGPDFSAWLENYKHAGLILNVKEEGIEEDVRKLMKQFKIENYFFLDLSFPALVRLVQKGEKHIALRMSKYESIESVMKMAGRVEWVWVDHLEGFHLTSADAHRAQSAGFQICLVSPELVGHEKGHIPELKMELTSRRILPDAVCTKFPEEWA